MQNLEAALAHALIASLAVHLKKERGKNSANENDSTNANAYAYAEEEKILTKSIIFQVCKG